MKNTGELRILHVPHPYKTGVDSRKAICPSNALSGMGSTAVGTYDLGAEDCPQT